MVRCEAVALRMGELRLTGRRNPQSSRREWGRQAPQTKKAPLLGGGGQWGDGENYAPTG